VVQTDQIEIQTDLNDLFEKRYQFIEKPAPETANGSVGGFLHRGEIHEGGIGVEFVLDLPTAECSHKCRIKEYFNKHSRVIRVLAACWAICRVKMG